MEFEWDEIKRAKNLKKHDIDFEDALAIFDGITIELPDKRKEYGEPRYRVIGMLEDVVIVVVYTPRKGQKRIISARKANRYERKIYKEVINSAQARPH